MVNPSAADDMEETHGEAATIAGGYENIKTEVRGKVAIITLHRPKVRGERGGGKGVEGGTPTDGMGSRARRSTRCAAR